MNYTTVGWRLAATLVLAIAAALGSAGCATGSGAAKEWPTADVVPAEAPKDLETKAPASLLRRGSNGFLYAVGGLPDGAEPGTPFLARYSGNWPLDDISRPALAAGRIVRTVGDEAAVVHLSYRMPEADVEGLEVTWGESLYSETVGKGVGQIESVSSGDPPTSTITIGRKSGVQTGDLYAVLRPPSTIDAPVDVQLTRRFKQLCAVQKTSDEKAECQLFGGTAAVGRGDSVVFLEHVLGKSPRKGHIQIASVAGASGTTASAPRKTLLSAFRSYADEHSGANIDIRTVEPALKATRDAFHRVENDIDYIGRPQIVVGAELVDAGDGPRHVVVNYTGIGPATGPGMIAAPPTGGVDLGPVDEFEANDVRGLIAVVWSGMLVYRGQNTRALAYLHDRLSSDTLAGRLRWHARDQYAMRWGALGRYGESVWLVRQDRAIARERYGDQAVLNAAGTLVRLYDFVGLTDRAVRAAKTYLDRQKHEKPETEWLAAVGMLGELQAASGSVGAAKKTVGRLKEACSKGCAGDLFAYLSSVWWGLGETDAVAYRNRLLSELVSIGQREGGRTLAAARLYQGIQWMRDEQFDQALIGFLEAARLYESADHLDGLARSKYFEMIANIRREKYQNAYEAGKKSLDLRKRLRDFEGVARTYNRLSKVYADVDLRKRPGRYLRSAQNVLTKAFESQRARGSYGRAGESLYTLGTFLFKFGQNESARSLLRKAVGFSISATRFDIAALSHLHLAMIARRNDRRGEFEREAERARLMAELAESSRIREIVERALNPKKQREKPDVPTEML